MTKLTPWVRNPRKIDEETKAALKRSLEQFGDLSCIVLNTRNNQLVGGHQRSSVLNEYATIDIDRRYDPPTAVGTTAEGSLVVNGERFKYREVDWTEERHAAANIAANNEFLAGEFTEEVNELLRMIEGESPELFESLRFQELAADLGTMEKPDSELGEGTFNYQSQHGVIVICKDETDQKSVFEDLTSKGYSCKVVVT